MIMFIQWLRRRYRRRQGKPVADTHHSTVVVVIRPRLASLTT